MRMLPRQAVTITVLCCLILKPVAADDKNTGSNKGNEMPSCGHTFANSTRKATNARIIQAQEAEKGAWPWMAEIYLTRRNKEVKIPSCGGVLISSSYVVTAGHCIISSRGEPLSPSDVAVRLGDHNLETKEDGMNETNVGVTAIQLHEEYDRKTYANDIAILRLEHPISFDKHIQPICLPESLIDEEDLTSKNAYVAGWGAVTAFGPSSDVLMEMTAVIRSDDDCRDAYEGKTTITELNICTVGRNGSSPCQGFGGSPLMLPGVKDDRYYFIGITSFGLGCGNPEFPDVYTRVSKYLDWIQQNLSQ